MLAANACGDAEASSTGRALVPRPMAGLTLENSAAPCPEGMCFPQEEGGGRQAESRPGRCRQLPTRSVLGPASAAGIVPPLWGEGKGTVSNSCVW